MMKSHSMCASAFRSLRAGLLAAGLLVPAAPAGAQEILVRLGHDTADDYQDALAHRFAEEAARLSDGRIEVEVYPANQLGSNESMNQQVRSGALQAIIQPSAFLTPLAGVLGVLDLPFLFPDEEVQGKVLNSGAAEPLNAALRSEGHEPVAWMTGGFKQFNTTFPVREAGNFDGRVIRTMTSDILVRQYESWGATVTTMSFSEVYTGLQQGTIEGQENPPDATYHRKLHEVAPYFTISNHGALTTVLTLSKQWFDALPEDVQEVLHEAGKATSEAAPELIKPFHEAAIEAMEEEGVEVVELPEEERAKLREMAEPVWDHIRQDPELEPVLAQLEAELQAYE